MKTMKKVKVILMSLFYLSMILWFLLSTVSVVVRLKHKDEIHDLTIQKLELEMEILKLKQ